MVLLAEAVDAIERFWGEDAFVRDSEGMEEVLQLIQAFTICIDKRVEILGYRVTDIVDRIH